MSVRSEGSLSPLGKKESSKTFLGQVHDGKCYNIVNLGLKDSKRETRMALLVFHRVRAKESK